MKILIVDDDDGMRFMLKKNLRDAGFEIVEARDMRSALFLMSEKPHPDLIFLDLWLPDTKNANETLQVWLEKLRSFNPNVVVVIITGDVDSRLVDVAKEVHADGFHEKMDVASQTNLLRAVKASLENRKRETGSGRELAKAGHEMIEKLAGLLALDT